MMKYIFLMCGLTLLAAGALWLEQQSLPKAETVPRQANPDSVHASGRIEGATQDVKLRFETEGRIVESPVREGQFVEAGTLLLKLDEQSQKQRVALRKAEKELAEAQLRQLKAGAHEHERSEAKSLLESRQAELKRAKQTWERSTQLSPGTVSRQEKEANQAQMDALIHQVAAAKAHLDFLNAPPREDEVLAAEARCQVAAAQLEMARVELAKTSLVAPSAGVVAKLGHEPGELTGPDDTEPAVLLVDTRKLRARVYVEEQDAGRVAVGQSVIVHLESRPGEPITGLICELAPRMSRKQAWSDQPDERYDLKTREVLIVLNSTEGLLPGLAVEVEIRTSGGSKVANENFHASKRLVQGP